MPAAKDEKLIQFNVRLTPNQKAALVEAYNRSDAPSLAAFVREAFAQAAVDYGISWPDDHIYELPGRYQPAERK